MKLRRHNKETSHDLRSHEDRRKYHRNMVEQEKKYNKQHRKNAIIRARKKSNKRKAVRKPEKC